MAVTPWPLLRWPLRLRNAAIGEIGRRVRLSMLAAGTSAGDTCHIVSRWTKCLGQHLLSSPNIAFYLTADGGIRTCLRENRFEAYRVQLEARLPGWERVLRMSFRPAALIVSSLTPKKGNRSMLLAI